MGDDINEQIRMDNFYRMLIVDHEKYREAMPNHLYSELEKCKKCVEERKRFNKILIEKWKRDHPS